LKPQLPKIHITPYQFSLTHRWEHWEKTNICDNIL